ncbi:MAG TPA: phosphatase PAP2 family protein, partial [Mycobacteriales bacterium]|nr:phosphatase PAP2 family protein [Mycobacteriales bacterium]
MFEVVNGLPGWLEPGMYLLQLGGLVGVPNGLAVLALALRRPRLAVALALSLPLKEILEHGVIKQLVDRRRPAENEPAAVLRHTAATQGLAFPSGHAIVAFTVAGLVAPYLPPPGRLRAGRAGVPRACLPRCAQPAGRPRRGRGRAGDRVT